MVVNRNSLGITSEVEMSESEIDVVLMMNEVIFEALGSWELYLEIWFKNVLALGGFVTFAAVDGISFNQPLLNCQYSRNTDNFIDFSAQSLQICPVVTYPRTLQYQ